MNRLPQPQTACCWSTVIKVRCILHSMIWYIWASSNVLECDHSNTRDDCVTLLVWMEITVLCLNYVTCIRLIEAQFRRDSQWFVTKLFRVKISTSFSHIAVVHTLIYILQIWGISVAGKLMNYFFKIRDGSIYLVLHFNIINISASIILRISKLCTLVS